MIRGRFTVLVVAIGLTLAGGGIAWAGASPGQSSALIAYVRGTATTQPSIWLAAANGSHARRLAAGDEALLSPNGADVAVALDSSHGPALIVYPTAGGAAHRFFNSTQVGVLPVAWSANSRYLAVQLNSTSLHASQDGLAVIDPRTWTARKVATGVIAGASFNPAGTTIVYGHASKLGGPSDLYVVDPDGSDPAQLTTDGRSLNPIWGARGIVFDRETARGPGTLPEYELWLRSGSRLTQLTHIKEPALLDGLVPVSVAAGGNRLLAAVQGEDTDEAWTVQLSPLEVKALRTPGGYVQGSEISSNGERLLVDVGGFEQPSDHGTVESVGFGGGALVRLVRGSGPSWAGQ